jgi:DNA-binding beta-propeller fold protein YncE
LLAWLALSAAQAQAALYALATSVRVEGPASGNDSVILVAGQGSPAWTTTANASWLHINQSGTGSTNVIFSYDDNSAPTRTGTLTIAGQTLTVTQAGSTYVQTDWVATLVPGLNHPEGVAVDASGNVYFADSWNDAIKEWTAANNSVTTLVSSGLYYPEGVAVDGTGNVYIADRYNNAIKEWTAANNSVTTLVSSGLYYPEGVAVDGTGNVYIADSFNSAIKEWTAANSNVTTLVSSGLNQPQGVAVDAANNVYIADTWNFAVKEWSPASQSVSTVPGQPFTLPTCVAVDVAGNMYDSSVYNSGIYVGTVYDWSAASQSASAIASYPQVDQPVGLAVDVAGNVYIADNVFNVIAELPYAFVDPTPRLESLAAGSDSLPAVLPVTENLLPPFAPTSDEPWLTITGITNGVVSFSFTATTANRTGAISLFGQTIYVGQGAITPPPPSTTTLATNALLVGPAAGSDSVVLETRPATAGWTAAANDAWLHLSLANQSGNGSTNVVFSYDANTGATRSGTLTIAGQTLTVTQAGANYVAAGVVTTLVPFPGALPIDGSPYIFGVAVDGSGNIYSTYPSVVPTTSTASEIAEWVLTDNTLTTYAWGSFYPGTVALDGAGNVYIADPVNNAIQEWITANRNFATLVSGLNDPNGVAVDGAGNVYIADTGNNAIKERTVSSGNVTTLVSSLHHPAGVAVDGAGNVYIADTDDNVILEWLAANSNVITLVSNGLSGPQGVAVDVSGNVYIADTGHNAVVEWTAASGNVTGLVFSESYSPQYLAVDGLGNVYMANFPDNWIEELPRAFVDPTPRSESAAAGSDALPIVLPATENLLPPFAPTSDQSWLTIGGITDGVVSFSFTANTGPARTARITVLGQSIPITQAAPVIGTPPTLTSAQIMGGGVFQFTFTNTPGATFTVLCTTNLLLPLNEWTVVGSPVIVSPGVFKFTSQPTTNDSQIYYSVRSP